MVPKIRRRVTEKRRNRFRKRKYPSPFSDTLKSDSSGASTNSGFRIQKNVVYRARLSLREARFLFLPRPANKDLLPIPTPLCLVAANSARHAGTARTHSAVLYTKVRRSSKESCSLFAASNLTNSKAGRTTAEAISMRENPFCARSKYGHTALMCASPIYNSR